MTYDVYPEAMRNTTFEGARVKSWVVDNVTSCCALQPREYPQVTALGQNAQGMGMILHHKVALRLEDLVVSPSGSGWSQHHAT